MKKSVSGGRLYGMMGISEREQAQPVHRERRITTTIAAKQMRIRNERNRENKKEEKECSGQSLFPAYDGDCTYGSWSFFCLA